MNSKASTLNSPMLPERVAQCILHDWKEPLLLVDSELRITFANHSFCDWVRVPWKRIDHKPLEQLLGDSHITQHLLEARRKQSEHDFQVECDIPRFGNTTALLNVKSLAGSKRGEAILIRFSEIVEPDRSLKLLKQKIEAAARADQAQRDQIGLLRSVMESTGDGIAVLDAKGNCILWNPASEEILGMNPGSIRCDKWSEHFGFYLPDQTTPFPAKILPLSKALKGEESNNVEIFVRNDARKDGVWINMTGRPLAGGKGGAVASFRDVTFAKIAADVLAAKSEDISRSNRELEQFAYVASHDLQEPLRMVASYVQLLARRYKGKLDSEADEFIAYATDGAKRMQQLINDLLGYARIGQGHVVYQPIECQEVFDQVVESLDEKIREAGATVTHDALSQITANETQIIQLFQNLIENAIKFKSEEPPRIHVSAQAKKNQWIFSFSDNGVGIAPEYKDRVFVIFQRLHNREAYPGTGIGLAICKKIVEQHAGQIWVETKPRKGTEIRFSWPRNPNLEQGRKPNA